MLYGGTGADAFIFKAITAMSGSPATIEDFNQGEGDKIDLSNLLSGVYDPITDAITDFVQITTSGANSIVSVDLDGTGTGHTFTQVVTIIGVTGLTDEHALISAGALVV